MCSEFVQVNVVLHEMAHAIGIIHEQSQPNRDSFVEILWNNIQSGMTHNFDIRSGVDAEGTPYDYRSVMHYGRRVSYFTFYVWFTLHFRYRRTEVTSENIGWQLSIYPAAISSKTRVLENSFRIYEEQGNRKLSLELCIVHTTC